MNDYQLLKDFKKAFPFWGRVLPKYVVIWLTTKSITDSASVAAEIEAAKHACVECGNPCASLRAFGCIPGDCAFSKK